MFYKELFKHKEDNKERLKAILLVMATLSIILGFVAIILLIVFREYFVLERMFAVTKEFICDHFTLSKTSISFTLLPLLILRLVKRLPTRAHTLLTITRL